MKFHSGRSDNFETPQVEHIRPQSSLLNAAGDGFGEATKLPRADSVRHTDHTATFWARCLKLHVQPCGPTVTMWQRARRARHRCRGPTVSSGVAWAQDQPALPADPSRSRAKRRGRQRRESRETETQGQRRGEEGLEMRTEHLSYPGRGGVSREPGQDTPLPTLSSGRRLSAEMAKVGSRVGLGPRPGPGMGVLKQRPAGNGAEAHD